MRTGPSSFIRTCNFYALGQVKVKISRRRDRLAPLQIGKAGQLQGWLEDWDL